MKIKRRHRRTARAARRIVKKWPADQNNGFWRWTMAAQIKTGN